MTPTDSLVIDLALRRGWISPAAATACRARGSSGAEETVPPVSPAERLQLLADEFGLPLLADNATLSEAALALVGVERARRLGVAPVGWGDATLVVGIADPLAVEELETLAAFQGWRLDLRLATTAAIGALLDGRPAGAVPAAETPAGATVAIPPGENDAPVVQLVEEIIGRARRRRASDIHLEAMADRLRLRFRVDGALQEIEALPRRLHGPLVARLKLMAGLSIAERRRPQDGRIRAAGEGAPLDLRVSVLPTIHGESVVMRLLDPRGVRIGLGELGLAGDHRAMLEGLIARPDGLVLVTGPTGSGKTTTLYACLHHLNSADRKIITVEDPIEYQLPGVNQVPVREAVGLTFATALRSILRQSPNVVLIGEIRDRETAEIAVNAALTGHLVFSTLHTNDAAGAIPRLLDLGVKPFLVAGALRAVVAQRLVRRVCPDCAAPAALPPELSGLAGSAPAGTVVRPQAGRGCARCRQSGYAGRVGVFEILVPDEAMRARIYDRVTASQLRAQAVQAGMRLMRTDGHLKVLAGATTLGEVVAATVGEAG